MKQGGKSLSEYYGELTEIFQELDHRDKVVMKDPDDVIAYQKSVERLRVHIFLAGLDGMFEQIREEILRKEPVPDLEDFYAQIQREASHQAALREDKEIYEATAMVSRNNSKPQVMLQNAARTATELGISKTVVLSLLSPNADAGLDVEDSGLNPNNEADQSDDNEYEQEKIIKRRPSSQKGLTLSEIKQMKYLSKVIDETIWIRTNTFANFREAVKDAELNDESRILDPKQGLSNRLEQDVGPAMDLI
ncbi:hypothetical protein COLO4_20800 [Corchorus olitorius]|uniref:Retrotransposon gag protein n=1 Tax=Corchorus olitorius TaxID=93759 RepID=A0A1R3IX06_9ROSI|nr:hypothetical protein COLO4_20800 [Corchorus olitorius]